MAFRASNILPADAYRTVKQAAVQLKRNLQSINSYLSVNNADYDYLRELYRTLERANNQFNNLKTTQGLAQYAKDQEVDQAYDVVTEFTAMQGAISSAMTWMNTNVPTNVTAKTPENWGDGTLISNEFTPAQTSGLRVTLDAIIAEIS